MENIRSVIKEKIKSCISCDLQHCPIIKQRLDQHVMSHHSSASPSYNDNQNKSNHVSVNPRISTESKVSTVKLDDSASTSDLSHEQLKKKSNKTNNYKQNLKQIISEWSKDIPNISEDPENTKQNKINELLEKIYGLYTETNKKYYETKLRNGIDEFLSSMLPQTVDEITMSTLKENLVNEIQELNNRIENMEGNIRKLRSSLENNNGTKDIAVNTVKTAFKRKVVGSCKEYCNTSTQISLNDSLVGDFSTKESNKSNNKIYIDNQVQHTLSDVFPYYASIYKNTVKNQNPDETEEEKVQKRSIFNWLLKLNKEGFLNFDQDIYYDSIVEDLFNSLKPILNLKSYRFDKCNLLKDEIFNYALKNINTSLNADDILNLSKLANSLAINLLNKKYYVVQNKYSENGVHKIIESHNEEDFDVLRLINDIVVNSLVCNGIYSGRLINNIIECVINNFNSKQNLKTRLSNYLNNSTDLSGTDIANIISNITKEINKLNYELDSSKKSNESRRNNVISVYKSEVDLMAQSNNTNSMTRRKSGIARNKNGKLNPEEINYMNKISAAITSWLDVLPIGPRKAKNKRDKQNFVQNLTSDILDQVKLHSLIEENSEKDRYIAFFIYRWLNRYELIENINKAKPFVDQLLKEITDIPVPIRNEETKDINFENGIFNDAHSSNTTEEFSKLKDRIIHLLNGLSPTNIKIKDKIKRNKIIDNLLLQVQKLITENQSINEISHVINNYITQIINSDQKEVIAKINKDVTDTAKNFLQNIHLVTSHQTNTHNKVKVSENILKNYILKYLDHRFDPEDSIAGAAFTQLLRNELDSLSTPIRHPHDSTTNYKQEEFLIDKLSKELEYINIIIDWLKSLPLEESFYTIDQNILARSINNLAKDIYEIEENLSSNRNRDRDNTYEIEIFLEQLPISPQNRRNIPNFINDLATKITNTKMCRGTSCQLPDCQTRSSVGKRSETEHDISNFIEEYIRNNSDEISQDDLKLEACILRFFDELNQKETEHLQSRKSLACHSDNNIRELQSNETARRFSFELGYANEISQWLKNLPLTPLIDEQSRTRVGNMVSSLAEKFFEQQMENKNFSRNENDLVDYISNWIVALPLDPAKNIDLPVAVQQLLNRLKRVDIDKYLIYSKRENDVLSKVNVNNKSHVCCGNQEDYLGSTVVNEIETWCSNLPLEPENENNNNTLKQYVATKLYQKIRELNMNPEYFNDDLLYRESLNAEIERLLDNLPTNPKLQSLKGVLKKQLLNGIMEKRNEIREKSSAIEYRHDLEKTIDISMPHPVSTYLKESPGFKIYKDHLASIFILENFDHGNDSVKQKYEERLKIEIDKYFQDVQERNSIPLSKDQIYNELYNALFSVPLPNESSIIEEVEEIKTRCEIDNWFETLPLNEPAGVGELLEWDQILAMLAKRLHEMEKIECGRDIKMHNEISKWLLRLPLLPCQKNNIDYFANNLQSRLRMTQQNRKCINRDVNRIDQYSSNNNDEINENSKNVQQYGSRINKDTPSLLPACGQTSSSPPLKLPQSLSPQESKNPADILIKIVENWCQRLPLSSKTPQERAKVMKENIATKIIMKISEMNMNPEIFENDFLYSGLLEDELDNQLAKLPTFLEFNKSDAKIQLINAVETVKPLIKEEKLRYEYKHELKNTIDNILNVPPTKNSKTTMALASLRDDIADDFIIFEFQTQDDESSQIKDKIYQRVQNFLELTNENEESSFKPLILTNELICELRKISVPSEFVIIEELKEIEIKFKISKLFDEISLTEDFDNLSNKSQVKSTLAKRLSEFEKLGYTKENCCKMKKEVIKYIRKIDDNEIDTKKVDEFIGTLQKSYPKRMSISYTVPQINDSNNNTKLAKSIEVGEADFSANTNSKQWHSLLPATSKDKNIQNNQDNTLNDTSTSYRTFGTGTGTKASSSVGKDQSKQTLEPNYSRYLHNNDQNTPHSSTISPKRPYRNNMSQSQVSGISDLTNTNRLENQNIQNIKSKGSSLYQPSLYSDSRQQYTRYQGTEENYTNRNPYFQNNIQPNKYSRHNQFEDNSFAHLSDVSQGVNGEPYKHSLARTVSVTRERWIPAVDSQNHPNARQLQHDKSLSSQDSIQRRSRRPSVTIFSPSYLEPNASQETMENIKCKSKKCIEGDKVKVECKCEKRDKIECRCDKKDEEKIECRCDKKYDDKIFCRCDKKYDDKISCRCSKKGKCKTNWSIDIRKYCKYCNRVHPFDCRMLNHPKCYY